MAEKKETAYDRQLRKAVEINPGMRVRDYYGASMFHDMYKSHVKPLQEFLDIGVGDHVMIISFEWKSAKHRERAEKRVRKLFGKHMKSEKEKKKLPKGLGRK